MIKRYVLGATLVLYLGSTALLAQQQKAPKDQKNSAGAEAQTSPAKPAAGAETQPTPPKPASGAESPTYVIGAEDVLDISVWQQPNVSRNVPVRPDGRISIPLVNDIQAAGLTPMQLAASITEKLKEFLNKPQVTVTVVQINSQKVFVVGEVGRPGPMMLLPNMTALQALSSAGGPSQFADQKRAYLLRREGGKDVTFPLNYKDLLRGDMRTNIILKAGDTIVVP